jgi:oxygen-independent coproporphyrinogen-3 oxidase
MSLLKTVSLYVHIPFCQTKCHYCDFNSYAGMLTWRDPYVGALSREIAYAGALAEHSGVASAPIDRPWPCRTIFLGGGTPSLLAVEQVQHILLAAREAFEVQDGAEVTL